LSLSRWELDVLAPFSCSSSVSSESSESESRPVAALLGGLRVSWADCGGALVVEAEDRWCWGPPERAGGGWGGGVGDGEGELRGSEERAEPVMAGPGVRRTGWSMRAWMRRRTTKHRSLKDATWCVREKPPLPFWGHSLICHLILSLASPPRSILDAATKA
jgi:hypothetical protein